MLLIGCVRSSVQENLSSSKGPAILLRAWWGEHRHAQLDVRPQATLLRNSRRKPQECGSRRGVDPRCLGLLHKPRSSTPTWATEQDSISKEKKKIEFLHSPEHRGPLSSPKAAMARGPRKCPKRVAAPKHWVLDKLTAVFAPRPSTGPHKLRECLPLIIFLRNRLKYAPTGDEVKKICMQQFIKIEGKVRTDMTYPAGFMDVISIDKTGENFRLMCDTKGRFAVHRITPEEAKYKLCKVRKIFVGTKGIPHLVTHDAPSATLMPSLR
ncbi:40S ribosomal protein S4 [Plecturocebus cupreus]